MRRGGLVVLLALAAIGFVLIAASVLRATAPTGPLQPTTTVNSFGIYADPGQTVSLVVELRGEQEATAVLDAVELANADPGLSLAASGVLVDGYPGAYVSLTYPMGELTPVNGYVVVTDPGNPGADVFINLGIATTSDLSAPQSVRGVWLDYTVDVTRYRALLPWLLTVCSKPVVGTCMGQPPDEFSFPPN